MTLFRYWLPVLFIFSLIFYFSSLPPDELPHLAFEFSDKINHFSAYGLLGFCLCRGFTFRLRNEPLNLSKIIRPVMITFILGTFYGISDEFHQSFTPGRSVEGLDVLADALGSLAGALMILPYRRIILRFKHGKVFNS